MKLLLSSLDVAQDAPPSRRGPRQAESRDSTIEVQCADPLRTDTSARFSVCLVFQTPILSSCLPTLSKWLKDWVILCREDASRLIPDANMRKNGTCATGCHAAGDNFVKMYRGAAWSSTTQVPRTSGHRAKH